MERHGLEYRAHTDEQKREVIARLQALWLQHPTLRLGQLIGNFFRVGDGLYAVEDFDFIEALEQGYKNLR